MLVTAVMTMIGTAGIAFYARFLVELRKECKRTIRCWVRLRVDSDQDEMHELREEKEALEEVLKNAA